jgi:3-methyladenine DNA glycosylase AlkD
MINKLIQEIKKTGNPARAKVMQGFFKTRKGQYGEGDEFLGLSVPQQRVIAKQFIGLGLSEIKQLLKSKIHEHRFIALVILCDKYNKASDAEKTKIYKFYLTNAKQINNWDLVDTSAPYIVGEYLIDKNKSILYNLAKSDNLWEKRISILSTFAFIKRKQLNDTFEIAKIFLNDKHDLIHKAVGWMLREAGKKSVEAEEKFLKKYYKIMPRTALRYAIEKFPKQKQKMYLSGRI